MRERERETHTDSERDREREGERERESKSPRHEQCARATGVLCAIYIHYSDYMLPSFRFARLLIKKRLPRVCLHVPSIRALVAAIAHWLARAARVDSFSTSAVLVVKRARERESGTVRE